jgi:gliding motility-associated-like protein
MNKNLFVSLKIFNRWGQLVFHSKDANKGWDGNLNNIPQATGIFIYYVEMKGLSGNKLSQKGTLLLIR